MRSIIQYPNYLLRQRALTVPAEEVVDDIVKEMFRTLKKSGGVGLAANQVGNSSSIFVYKLASGETGYFTAPDIIWMSDKYLTTEGCLSLDGRTYVVTRYRKIQVRSFNRGYETLTGEIAQIFQHEYDHLQGILICDHGINKEKEEVS